MWNLAFKKKYMKITLIFILKTYLYLKSKNLLSAAVLFLSTEVNKRTLLGRNFITVSISVDK